MALQVLWDHNNTDTYSIDITNYVKDINIASGLSSESNTCADIGSCNLTLNNKDLRFSPENSSSPYSSYRVLGAKVKVILSSKTLFIGHIKSVEVTPTIAPMEATWRLEDMMSRFQDAKIKLPILEDRRSDELIQMVMDSTFGVSAPRGSFVFSTNPANNDTFSFSNHTYTFKTALGTARDVKIGTNMFDTMLNAIDAINGTNTTGAFHSSTLQNPDFSAYLEGNYFSSVTDKNPIRYYRMLASSGTVEADYGSNIAQADYSGFIQYSQTPLHPFAGDDKSILFAGTAVSYMTAPQLDFKSRSFSIEMWIRPNASLSADQTIFSVQVPPNGTSDTINFRILTDGTLQIVCGAIITSSSGAIAYTGGTADIRHIAFIHDSIAGQGRLYINGSLAGSASSSGFTGSINGTINIARTAWGAEYFRGWIDEVSIYWDAIDRGAYASVYGNTSYGTLDSYNTNPAIIIVGRRKDPNLAGKLLSESSSAISLDGTPPVYTGVLTSIPMTKSNGSNVKVAGDRWSNGQDAMSMIQEIMDNERGIFFISRSGVPTFIPRWEVLNSASKTTVIGSDSEHSEIDAEYSLEDVKNHVIVRYRPRSETTTGVIARIQNVVSSYGKWGASNKPPDQTDPNSPPNLPELGATTINVPFIDIANGKISGAKDLKIPLEKFTDYIVTDAPDGLSGFDYTNYIYDPDIVRITLAGSGSSIALNIANYALGTLYFGKLQIRGTGIISYDETQIEVEDEDSIALYGRKSHEISLPLEADFVYAQALASYTLNRFKTARHRIKNIGFKVQETKNNLTGSPLTKKLIDVEIGDKIAIKDTNLGINSARYFLVIGVSYGISASETLAVRTKFNLMELSDTTYWVLGTSALNSSTRLGI